MKYNIILLACVSLAAACSPLPDQAYKTPGQPESLLEKSSERVSFSLAPKTALDDLTSWIDKDQPSKATLSCAKDNATCSRAAAVLKSFGVPYNYVAPKKKSSDIVLIYERITVQNCENSFVDNRHNFRNLHYPSFGCSVSANIVQTVNSQQITNPALSGLSDAEKAVRAIDAYKNGTEKQLDDSTPSNPQTLVIERKN